MSASSFSLPSLATAPWLKDPRTQSVLNALEDQGHHARVVGGAVRNALLHLPVSDVDIATTALPEETLVAARVADLKAVPTGQAHGTITIVADSVPFEVTTLRRDVTTDGRHAKVAFTDDWTEDAARRDFTINALYCSKAGVVFDPVDGLQDLRNRRVRFIGDAHQRIQEDYLRILRFFRFTATYGEGKCDANGLAACTELRAGVHQLSGERVWAELKKLLVAPHIAKVITPLDESKLLDRLFKPACRIVRLQRLISIDRALKQIGDPVQRLAALIVQTIDDATWLRERLRLSSREFDRLALLAKSMKHAPTSPSGTVAQTYIYRHGVAAFQDHVLVAWSSSEAAPDDPRWREALTLPERWSPPEFPISGADILALGIAPGPNVGKILAKVEQWWIDQDFPNDPKAVRAHLADVVKVTKT